MEGGETMRLEEAKLTANRVTDELMPHCERIEVEL